MPRSPRATCRFCHADIVHAIDTFPRRGERAHVCELSSQRRTSPLTWLNRDRPHACILYTALAAGLAAAAITALLVNIFERKQEALNPFFRVVELSDQTEDPAIWGKNFPLQYDGYRRTVDQVRTRYGRQRGDPEARPVRPIRARWSPSRGSRRTRG